MTCSRSFPSRLSTMADRWPSGRRLAARAAVLQNPSRPRATRHRDNATTHPPRHERTSRTTRWPTKARHGALAVGTEKRSVTLLGETIEDRNTPQACRRIRHRRDQTSTISARCQRCVFLQAEAHPARLLRSHPGPTTRARSRHVLAPRKGSCAGRSGRISDFALVLRQALRFSASSRNPPQVPLIGRLNAPYEIDPVAIN